MKLSGQGVNLRFEVLENFERCLLRYHYGASKFMVFLYEVGDVLF